MLLFRAFDTQYLMSILLTVLKRLLLDTSSTKQGSFAESCKLLVANLSC